MECDQMRFIFQHGPPCSSHTSPIGVAVLGSHCLPKFVNSRYEIILWTFQPTLIFYYSVPGKILNIIEVPKPSKQTIKYVHISLAFCRLPNLFFDNVWNDQTV